MGRPPVSGYAAEFRRVTRSDFPLLARWLATPAVARWWNHEWTPEAVERDFGPSVDGEPDNPVDDPLHHVLRLDRGEAQPRFQ